MGFLNNLFRKKQPAIISIPQRESNSTGLAAKEAAREQNELPQNRIEKACVPESGKQLQGNGSAVSQRDNQKFDVIPLELLTDFCFGDTFKRFQSAFPEGVPVDVSAIKACFNEWSPLDPLCGILNSEQRRRVMARQLRAYIKSDWLAHRLQEMDCEPLLKRLFQLSIDNLEDISNALVFLEEVRVTADAKSLELSRQRKGGSQAWQAAHDVELNLRLQLNKFQHFSSPEWHHVVMHGNACDESTAAWIVRELRGDRVE